MMLTFGFLAISAQTGLIAAAVFFLVFVVVAYIVFRMLKRTVKMVFRLGIVAMILAVAVAGSVSLWALGKGNSVRPGSTRSK